MATEAQCGECGESNPSDSAFCLLCGAYLGWNEPGKGPQVDVARPTPTAEAVPSVTGARPATGAETQAAAPQQPLTTSSPLPTTRSTAVPGKNPCPSCGHPNDVGRRFCGRCGFVLVTPTPAQRERAPAPAAGRWMWWGDPKERAARRAYRRSLPPLYRWRRVIVGLVLVVLVGAVLSVLDNNPVAWLRDRWTAWTADLVPIPDVAARADPQGSVAATYAVASLTDSDRRTAWATPWPAGTETASSCGASSVGGVVLTWSPAARVYRIDVRAGLASDDDQRNNQFQPARVDISIAGECVKMPLGPGAGWQQQSVDVKAPVSTLTLTVAGVRPNQRSLEPVVAISELRLMTKAS